MSQNNPLLPDGYRYWTDTDGTETKKIALTKQSEDLTWHSKQIQSPDVEKAVDTQNVVEDNAEVEVFHHHREEASESDCDLVLGNDSIEPDSCNQEFFKSAARAQPIEITIPKFNRQNVSKPASPTRISSSSIADFWLQSIQAYDVSNGTEVASQWTEHSQLNHGWPDDNPATARPSVFWRCDNSGKVVWFMDQNQIGWSRNSEHENIFCSNDGGQRAADVCLTTAGCCIEDSDGTVLTISLDGTCAIENRRKFREENVRRLLEVFVSIDKNGDERLSHDEIEGALQQCAEKDQPLIKSLKTHFKRIEWTRRGMFGQVTEGLSLREILDFTSDGRGASDDIDETLLLQIEAIIDFADPKCSGFVNDATLQLALSSLKMPVRLRRTIEILNKRLKEVSLLRYYGFSSHQWQPTRQSIRLMLCDVYKNVLALEGAGDGCQIATGIDRGLFADESDPLSSISIDAISNCVEAHQSFMSVVAATIVHNPEIVLRTIRPSDNGAFLVTFVGDRNAPVRVLLPAQKEINEYGLASKYGVWALILARGWDQYLEQKFNTGNLPAPHEILQLLTGLDINLCSVKDQCSNELAQLIDRLWAQDQAMVLCRFPHMDQDIRLSVLKHTCAITGWEPQSGMISFSNPQSRDVERISVDALQTSFDSLLHS